MLQCFFIATVFFMGANTQPEVVVIRNSLLNVIITLLREYLTSHVPGLEKHTKKKIARPCPLESYRYQTSRPSCQNM